jgi:arginine exporter protein ArgO
MAAAAEHDFWGTLSVIALAIVGVASLAILISKNANTTGVITASGNAFTNALGVALSPVTGGGSGSTFPIG